MRISDWSSDVCSSDLRTPGIERRIGGDHHGEHFFTAVSQRLAEDEIVAGQGIPRQAAVARQHRAFAGRLRLRVAGATQPAPWTYPYHVLTHPLSYTNDFYLYIVYLFLLFNLLCFSFFYSSPLSFSSFLAFPFFFALLLSFLF